MLPMGWLTGQSAEACRSLFAGRLGHIGSDSPAARSQSHDLTGDCGRPCWAVSFCLSWPAPELWNRHQRGHHQWHGDGVAALQPQQHGRGEAAHGALADQILYLWLPRASCARVEFA